MFKRLGNLIRGFFSLFISGLEKNNPEAVIAAEKENLRKQISEYNKGLAKHAGLCERLKSQIKGLERKVNELTAKATANLKAGNRALAGQYALRLKEAKESLTENQEQSSDAESTYEELLRARDVAVKSAREKISSVKRDVDEMKMNKAMAELNEMASGMISEIGGGGDTLDRLHEAVQEDNDEAKGRARIAKDSVDTSDIDAMAGEQKALEDLALADFAADAGIVLDQGADSSGGGKTEEAESEKTM
ncbi:MAG: phage shock protein A [Verrucomicrobiales bacterium]|jgi:phage shock protein A